MDDINNELYIRKTQLRALLSAITEAMEGDTPSSEAIHSVYEAKLSLAVELQNLPQNYFEKWHDSLFDNLDKIDTDV